MNRPIVNQRLSARAADGRDRLGFPTEETAAHSGRTLELALPDVWRILVEHRKLVLAGLVFGVLAGLAVAMLTTPRYRAAATLEIGRESVQIMDSGNNQPLPMTDTQSLETSYGLLKSTALAERVAQRLKLPDDPGYADPSKAPAERRAQAAATLLEAFTVEPVTNSRLVRIGYVSLSPALAAAVPNTYGEEFIASVLERRYEANNYARRFLQNRLAEVRTRLETSERRLVGYAQRENIVTVGGNAPGQSSQSLDAASLAAANAELSAAQNARVAAEQRLRQANSGSATTEMLQNSTVQQLRSSLAQLRTEYDQKRTRLRPEHPEMVNLSSGIAAIEANIARESSTVQNSLAGEFRTAAAREAELRARVASLTRSVLDLQGRNIQYAILQRDADTNRQLYDALLQRYKEVGVSGGVGENLISIVDTAPVPARPFEPNPFNSVLLGGLLGIVASIAAALGLAIVTNKVRSFDDLENKLAVKPLGVIPLGLRDTGAAEELADPRSPLAEAYASLRSAIQFELGGGKGCSLLITSSGPGEGKTTTALALAQSFGRLGLSTLLIDADLRHPSLQVETGRAKGLTELLLGEVGLKECIQQTGVDRLAVMVSGRPAPNPADLLSDDRLEAALAEAKRAHDVVIVDSPPTLGLADAPLLAAACDYTLLVVEANKVRMPAARNAVARLTNARAHILGGILTKFDSSMSSYGYGYGYGYGATDRRSDNSAITVPFRFGEESRHEAATRDPQGVSMRRKSGNVFSRLLFWAAMLVAFSVAVMPEPVNLGWTVADKIQHFGGFAVIAAMAAWAYPRLALPLVGLGLAAFGGLIELVQMLPAVGRSGEIADFLTNVAAIGVTLSAVAIWRLTMGARQHSER